MAVDQREKALSASKLFFRVPPSKRTLVALLLATSLLGFAFRIYAGNGVSNALVYGVAEGVLLLGLPALLAAALSSLYYKEPFKYNIFIGATAAVIAGTVYLVGFAGGQLVNSIILANALCILLWFSASFVGLNQGVKSIPASFLQAFFNASFLWFWQRFGFIESSFAIGSLPLAAIKILVSSGILLLGLWAVFYVVNAPAKRNFGISTIQAVALFFSQWTTGKKEFEEILAEMGEPVETTVEGVVFKNVRGKTKAVFFSPQVHFGPFGNVGGSEFPFLLSQKISFETKAPCFVFHSTVNHDFNPVYSSTHALISKKALQAIAASSKNFSSQACFVHSREGSASVAGFAFGKNAFLTLSRAPESTEDIELSLGLALKNSARRKFGEAIIVDRHNSLTDGSIFRVGSREFLEFEKAVSGVENGKQNSFRLGVSERSLDSFTLDNGVGKAGLKTAVFEIRGKKYCIALIDGNNILPSFRANALLSLRNYGFEWADIFSTDTHSANKIGGVHNPVGRNLNHEKLIEEIRKGVDEALENREECKAAFFSDSVGVSVLGGRKQSELTSTINSVVAITRVLAPAIFAVCVLAVLFLLLAS
ncbi:MAG: DUF2070 family protein [Candidatus Norongarragalinales archaeon]